MVPMRVCRRDLRQLEIKLKGNGLMLCGGPRKGATVTDFLTNDEISLLRSLEKKSRTITGNLTHKRYDRLETKGYIKRSSQSPSMQDMLYEITDAGKAALRAAGGAAG
jgi:DNA-binding PadR family transcriptional regulator